MAVSTSWTVKRFLAETASARPSPGGGAAAALSSALGCALGLKVCRLVLKRRKTPARAKPALRRAQLQLSRLTRRLEGLVRKDALAYERVARAAALAALPSPTRLAAGARARSLARARAEAVRCPLEICDLSVQGLKAVSRLRPLAGKHLGSDLDAARALLRAGFTAADRMVEINLVTSK